MDESPPLAADEEAVMLHPLTPPIALPPSLQPHRLGNTGAAYLPNILSVQEEQTLMREVRSISFACSMQPVLGPPCLTRFSSPSSDLCLPMPPHPPLLSQIYASSSKWTPLTARRLQNWGGIVRASGMREEALPAWLLTLQERLAYLFPCPFNHVLINEYLPGQGIFVRTTELYPYNIHKHKHTHMRVVHAQAAQEGLRYCTLTAFAQAHEDGPLYYPMVAIVSLNNGILIEFHKKRQHTESGQQERAMSVYLQPRSLFVFAEELYTHHLHVIEPTKTDPIDKLVRLPLRRGEQASECVNLANAPSAQIRRLPE